MIHATHNGEKAGTANNPYTRSGHLRFAKTNMIVGRCVWGKTDEDRDTLEIYRVFDAPELGPLALKKPVCELTEVIPQSDSALKQRLTRSASAHPCTA